MARIFYFKTRRSLALSRENRFDFSSSPPPPPPPPPSPSPPPPPPPSLPLPLSLSFFFFFFSFAIAQMRAFKGSEPSRTPHRRRDILVHSFLFSLSLSLSLAFSFFDPPFASTGKKRLEGADIAAAALHLGDLPRFTSLKRCRGY